MIAGLALVVALAGQDLIHVDVSGQRRWRVALEGPGGAVAFTPAARVGDTREVVLITTARVVETPGSDSVLMQGFFVHFLDCRAWTQAQTGFGNTDPAPRRWTPMDGPPVSRPVATPRPIQPNTAMATVAEVLCRDSDMTLPEIEGEWSEVSRALRNRLEASSRSVPTAGAQ